MRALGRLPETSRGVRALLVEALRVRAGVAAAAVGQREHVGRATELLDHLERGGLLTLDPVRVERVDEREVATAGELLARCGALRRRSRAPRARAHPRRAPARASAARSRRPACSTTAGIPARAAYAAADAAVLPVDAQTIPCAPSSSAFATATAIPRSLNEPVGFAPSNLNQSSTPSRSPRARRSGSAACRLRRA